MLYINGEPVLTIGKGHALWTTDNTYDIGAAGATRPRTIYVGKNLSIKADSFGTNADGVLGIGTGTAPTTAPADMVQMWVADRGGTAGAASLHIMAEGAISHVLGDRVGFGTVTPNNLFNVHVAAGTTISGASPSSGITFSDSTAVAANVGAGLILAGITKSTGEIQPLAVLKAYKSLATDDNLAGGLIIFTNNNTQRYPVEAFRVTSQRVLTSLAAEPTNVTAAGAMIAGGGLAFTDVLNAWIDDASHGTGTTTHYIGNAAILTGNGVSFGPGGVTSITVVNGQITAIS